MRTQRASLDFERAAELRDRIRPSSEGRLVFEG